VPEDPLNFSDGKPYKDRLIAARKATGEGRRHGHRLRQGRGVDAVVLVQDFAFMGGSLGMAAGEGFIAAARRPRWSATCRWSPSPPPAAPGCRKARCR
jgi:acetyl-CoA carboxylase carboxyl transferase subunit beta